MRHKPVLFLDFDRTLFDTERFYTWLGGDRYANILALMSGELPEPDFKELLYPDVLPFLSRVKEDYRLVLLTFAVNVLLQRRKVKGTGIVPLLDDIIMTTEEKGIAAKAYLERLGDPGWEHCFVDDAPENIEEMKRTNPDIRVALIVRPSVLAAATEDEKSERANTRADIVVSDLNELLTHLV